MVALAEKLALKYFVTTSLSNARTLLRDNVIGLMESSPEVLDRVRAVLPTPAVRPFDELVAALRDWK